MPAQNFANAIAISGSFGPGSTIPGGTSFTTAWLGFLDPGSNSDQGLYSEGETGSELLIDGFNVGAPPLIYGGSLVTDAGTFSGQFLVFAGTTYFFPFVANQMGTFTSMTAITSGAVDASSDSTFDWELFTTPLNAYTFTGDVYYESYASGALNGSGVSEFTIYDYDGETAANDGDNNQSFLPELGTIHFTASTVTEGTVLVSKVGGGFVSGLNVVRVQRQAGSNDDYYYLFDPAGLAAEGMTLADIAGVGSFTTGSHAFDNWTDLGLTAQPLTFLGTNEDDIAEGTELADTLNGEDGADTLNGNGGNDAIYDGAGDDIVNGGAGNDDFYAGAGADTYTGGSGYDELFYSDSDAGVTIYLDGVTAGTGGYAQGDIVNTDIENIFGSNFDDTFYGNITTLTNIEAGDGADTIYVGLNSNSSFGVDGGNGDDTIIIDTDYTPSTSFGWVDGGGDTDTVEFRATTASEITIGSSSIRNVEAFRFDMTGTNIEFTVNLIDEANEIFGVGSTVAVTGDTGSGNVENLIVDMTGFSWDNGTTVVDLSAWTFTDWGGENTISVIGHIDVANTLTGSSQNDILWSGTLDDALAGGAGNDTASYANATAGVTVDLADETAQDTIGAGTDTLTGIENVTGSAFDDTLYGSLDTNIIRGGEGNDTLLSLSSNVTASTGSNDVYYGEGGDDTLGFALGGLTGSNITGDAIFDGGDGSDTFTIEYYTDFGLFITDLNSGIFSFNGIDYATLVSIENVNANIGDDLIIMSSADNTIDGNAGSDTVSYSAATSGVTVNLAATGAQDTGFGMDTFIEVENVIGSAFADSIVGFIENGTSDGAGGNDTFLADYYDHTFIGGEGVDTLNIRNVNFDPSITIDLVAGTGQLGAANTYTIIDVERFLLGGGDDTVILQAGAYHVDGWTGTNTLDFSQMASVNIDLSGTVANQRAAAGQTYVNFQTAIGSTEGDILRGLIGEASTLDGGDGDDFFFVDHTTTIIGGSGYDRVIVREGSAAVNYNLSALGIEQVTGSAFDDVFDATSMMVGVKLFGGDGDDFMAGSNEVDILDGNRGDDELYGFGGNDRLDGLQGADIMDGGAGDDVIYIDQLDTIQGGIGYDRVFVRGYAVGVNLDLGATGIEFANGNIRDDIFDASTSAVAVKLLGQRGNDTLTGSDFDDFISGGLDDDILIGNGGSDILKGSTGADTFDGGAGDDKLFIDADDTSVIGGSGYDRVFITTSADTTVQMTTGGIEFVSANGGNDTLIASGQTVAVKVLGQGGNDFLIGGSQADLLYGGTGDDRLLGGNGDDFLHGGSGTDTFVFSGNWGDDRIADFDATNGDIIEMDSLGITFADLMISTVAGGTLVEYGTNSILLSGVNIADVDAADFSF